jgi:hypothetical protein
MSVKWGSQNFEEVEIERPGFYGDQRRSIVTDSPSETYFDPTRRYTMILIGVCVSIFMIGIVILFVGGLTFIRAEYTGKYYTIFGLDLGRWLFSLAISLQIEIFNHIYYYLATLLTEKENHKT